MNGSAAPRGETVAAGLAVTASLLLGASLRLVNLLSWPPGPYVDEALALRAARSLAADPAATLWGTTPLLPAEAGFQNAYIPNLYLALASRVDGAAGGGLASLRALSLLPALVLLIAVTLLAREAGRNRSFVFPAAAFLAATSMVLLTTARWGWMAVFSSALLVLAAWAWLVAERRQGAAWGVLAGAFLGFSLYGYQAARAALLAPPLALAAAALRVRRDPAARRAAAVSGAVLAGALLVAGPLLLHFATHPGRALARERELSMTGRPPAVALAALGRNVRDYALLFTVGGDRNERHGDPGRPVLPPAVLGFAAAGLGVALAQRGPESRIALFAGLCLLAGLLAREESGANAFRISPAIPFLLVLAAAGARAVVDLIPSARRRAAGLLAAGLLLWSGISEVEGFLGWGASPRTWGAFGGPERELADAIRAERTATGARPVFLAPAAARNDLVVDVLLGGPGDGGRRQTRSVASFREARAAGDAPLLYADGGELQSALPADGQIRLLRRGRDPWGQATFALYLVTPVAGR